MPPSPQGLVAPSVAREVRPATFLPPPTRTYAGPPLSPLQESYPPSSHKLEIGLEPEGFLVLVQVVSGSTADVRDVDFHLALDAETLGAQDVVVAETDQCCLFGSRNVCGAHNGGRGHGRVAPQDEHADIVSYPSRVIRIDDNTPYTDDLGVPQRRLVHGVQSDDINCGSGVLAVAGGQDDPRVDQDTGAEPGLGSVRESPADETAVGVFSWLSPVLPRSE